MTHKIIITLVMIIMAKSTFAVDCNACNYNVHNKCKDKCTKKVFGNKVFDPICYSACLPEISGKKTACKTAAVSFGAYLDVVKSTCTQDPGRMDEKEKIDEAKNILIRRGYFKSEEFRNVKIRWCKIHRKVFNGAEFGGYGMAPDATLILFENDLKGSSPNVLAGLLAHEMIHIRQYHRWTSDGFKCRYSGQIFSGNKWGCHNSVEEEAYNFGKKVCTQLGVSCKGC